MSELDAPPPPPLLGEGSLEELLTLLWKTHKVTVDEFDPILMVHTIHKVAIVDFQRMLDRYSRVYSDMTNEAAQAFSDDVKQSIEELKSTALTDAVRERLATIKDTAELTNNLQNRLRKSARQILVLTILNYLGVAITLGVLIYVIK